MIDFVTGVTVPIADGDYKNFADRVVQDRRAPRRRPLPHRALRHRARRRVRLHPARAGQDRLPELERDDQRLDQHLSASAGSSARASSSTSAIGSVYRAHHDRRRSHRRHHQRRRSAASAARPTSARPASRSSRAPACSSTSCATSSSASRPASRSPSTTSATQQQPQIHRRRRRLHGRRRPAPVARRGAGSTGASSRAGSRAPSCGRRRRRRPARRVRIRWLGTAGHVIETATTTLLIDPFLTRPSLAQLTGRIAPDEAADPRAPAGARRRRPVRSQPLRSPARRAVHRAHDRRACSPAADHLPRSPAPAESPSRSSSSCRRTGRTFTVGDVTIRFVPSLHGRIVFGRVPFPGEVATPPPLPARAWHYRMGGAFGILVEAGGLRVYHNGSADLIDAELRRRARRRPARRARRPQRNARLRCAGFMMRSHQDLLCRRIMTHSSRRSTVGFTCCPESISTGSSPIRARTPRPRPS